MARQAHLRPRCPQRLIPPLIATGVPLALLAHRPPPLVLTHAAAPTLLALRPSPLVLTDAAASAVALGCHALDTLHLSQCVGITDAGLRLMLPKLCRSLTFLHLFGCSHLSDAVLAESLGHCHGLRGLDLSSTSITDACVLAVARACPYACLSVSLLRTGARIFGHSTQDVGSRREAEVATQE